MFAKEYRPDYINEHLCARFVDRCIHRAEDERLPKLMDEHLRLLIVCEELTTGHILRMFIGTTEHDCKPELRRRNLFVKCKDIRGKHADPEIERRRNMRRHL